MLQNSQIPSTGMFLVRRMIRRFRLGMTTVYAVLATVEGAEIQTPLLNSAASARPAFCYT